MIASLKGIVKYIFDDHIIIETSQGVGYIVYSNTNQIRRLELGKPIFLFIETHIREDQFNLFGFLSLKEQRLFNILRSVKGVGNKVAMTILSSITSIDSIYLAISSGDEKIFETINGIGKKIAARIIHELREKIMDQSIINFTIVNSNINSYNQDNIESKNTAYQKKNNISSKESNIIKEDSLQEGISLRNDAINALTNLGINRIEASSKIDKITTQHNNKILSLEFLIKEGLKNN
ncbi:MAG TPA: Holliday junction ATP-dependent DNA helicase RuvA [Candidatus Megaira endosymbiont of Hartmannula sinica]|nr:Holliday junction ATP-dependent DNA helicase RuvA [Candidatus Megaera endosymbiont of Hartmannula sinica]